MIFKILVLDQMPLSSGIFITPVVSFPWEIDPFRMSEFIAHKIQISTSGGEKVRSLIIL